MGDNPITKAIGLVPTDRAAILHVEGSGTASSGSRTAPCPSFRVAAARCAKRPGLDLGVHSTLRGEQPGCRKCPPMGASAARRENLL